MPHVYRCVIESAYEGQRIQNVMWIKKLTDTDGSKALDVAQEVISKWSTHMRGIFSSNLTFIHVDAICVTMPEGQGSSIRQNFTGSNSGTLAGPRQAPFVAVCWTLGTGLVQPRGHLFMSGVTNNDVSSGALNDTGFGRHTTSSTGLLGPWGVNGPPTGYRLGVWSKKLAGPIRPHNPAAWFQVTSVFVNRFLTSMDTRRAGVGF